jgi:hypothetical protein
MAQVTVAEDVLSGQPEPVRELDVNLLVERDIQEWLIDHWLGEVRFLVSPGGGAPLGTAESQAPTEQQLDNVATAVRAAVERFWLVEESGRELPGSWAVPDSRTPDVVLGPLRSDAGIVVATRTQDGVTVPMGEALVKILREELEGLDEDTHIACLPSEVELNDLTPWDDPAPAETATENQGQSDTMFWYVTRWVETTVNGFRRQDTYYLRADMTWVADPAEGVSFAEADDDSVRALLVQLRAEAGGDHPDSINAHLLAATSDEPHPLRPEETQKEE